MLIELDGMPVLGHVIARSQKISGVDEVVVATTSSDQDDEVANCAEQSGVAAFRGDERDVLARYRDCAVEAGADVVVRITGDCPLIDPEISGLVVNRFLQGDSDYVSNFKPPTFPDGLDTEVFSFGAIDEAYRRAARPSEREHVTPYIWQQPDKFRVVNIAQDDDRSGLCWTLDSPSDLEMIEELARRLDMPLVEAGQRELLNVIDDHPEIALINGEWIRNDKMESMFVDEGFYGPQG